MAVNAKDKAIKLSNLPVYQQQRELALKNIRSDFSKIKASNISDILSYGESLFDLYTANGIDPSAAQEQVRKDIKKDVIEIDNYGYLKRDINPFKAIGGVEEIKTTKEFIVKKYIPDEDPKDFYLKHTGSGTFNIYHRTQMHTYYTDDGMPLIFNYNQMVNLKKEMSSAKTEKITKEVMQSQVKTKERLIREEEFKGLMP